MFRSVLRLNGLLSLARGAVAAALALTPSHALAAETTHNTLASFRQNVTTDYDYEPFDGPTSGGVALGLPTVVGAGGFSYSVPVGVYRTALGICVAHRDQALEFNFSGRPVSAFGGTFKVATSTGSAPIAGNFLVQTNTGLVFPVSVPAGGAFFGFTSTEPFTSLIIADAAGANYEFIDDVYVGAAINATDTCGDARTLSPTSTTAYPFATTGNTAESITSVCDGAIDTGPDIWFRFVAPVTGSVTFNTCGCTFDSILRVFPSCPVGGLGGAGAGEIVCNDDYCIGGPSLQSRASQVTFRTVAGEDYVIRISGHNGAAGSGNLTVSPVPDCPGDFDHSGVVSIDDLFKFINAWLITCP